MQNRNLEIPLLVVLTVAIFSFISYLAIISNGIEGGMDSYNHYLIARYSWSYPSLFLDQWGKPIYNILASPFAQFGMYGTILLNGLSLLGCSILAYRIVKKINIKYAWLAYVLTITSPIFLDNIISSLTEPLCAFLVTLTIYLYSSQKYISAAVIASFLPFARSEGFIILFAVTFFLIFVDKQYKSVPYIFVGSMLFNLLGWAIEGEPFWIITSNPYINFELSGRNVCGSGGIGHYYYSRHYTFGLLASALAALSAAIYGIKLFTKERKKDLAIGLILMSFVLYFGSHVMIWWLGKMGSCGYVRVMVVIAPLAAILIVYTVHQIFHYVNKLLQGKSKVMRNLGLAFIVLNSIYTPYRYYAYKYPLQVSAEQSEYQKLAQWYKSQDFQDRRKIYLYPYFSIIADINPYNKKEHLDFWASSLEYAQDGDILMWDGHFGPHESGTPLKTLENDSTWKKIHSIIPSEPILTLNDKEFEIHVFEKIK